MPYKSKPKGWEDKLNEAIREGLSYKDTNERLIESLGAEGEVSQAAYQRHKKKITGGKEVDEKLSEIGEAIKEQKAERTRRTIRPAWTKTKQNAADTSKLAMLINKGMFGFLAPMCANRELKEEDVQEINLGGAIVGTVTYYVPGLPLDHPLITLATRGILLYLAFKRICSKVKEIKERLTSIGGKGDGLNPDYGPEAKIGL